MLPAGTSCGREHQPVKALNDNALQHDLTSDVVTLVTSRFVRCLAKKAGLEVRIIFRNRWGRNCHKGSATAKSGLCGHILLLLSQLFRCRELRIGLEAAFTEIHAFVFVLLVHPNPQGGFDDVPNNEARDKDPQQYGK